MEDGADEDVRARLAAATSRMRALGESGVAPKPREEGDDAPSPPAIAEVLDDEPEPQHPTEARGSAPWSAVSLAALAITAFWAAAVVVRILQPDARVWLADAPLDRLALAALGAAAPLIAVWVAAGHIRIARAQSTDMKGLQTATAHLAAQSRSADLTARHLRLETYLRLSSFHLEAMAREAAVLARGLYGFDASEEDRLWGRYAQGDRDVFFRLFSRDGPKTGDALATLIARDDEAARSAHALSGHFAVFMTLAEDVDRGNLMTEGHRRGHLGALARTLNVALYGDPDPFSAPRPDSDA
ncbi:MAG: hypothetical protein AAF684_06690 [Pseudomonadota bacterium]